MKSDTTGLDLALVFVPCACSMYKNPTLTHTDSGTQTHDTWTHSHTHEQCFRIETVPVQAINFAKGPHLHIRIKCKSANEVGTFKCRHYLFRTLRNSRRTHNGHISIHIHICILVNSFALFLCACVCVFVWNFTACASVCVFENQKSKRKIVLFEYCN